MSWILTYLMVGVGLLFLYDKAVTYTSAEFRLTAREQFIIGLIWPIGLLIFIYNFIKVVFK